MRLLCSLVAAALALTAPAAANDRFDPFNAVDIEGTLGAALPLDAGFRDASGAAVTLGGLIGDRPAVLAPVYYTCPNVCSVTLDAVMTALSAVPLRAGKDYIFIAYSIDPREGPADARKAREAALTRLRGKVDDAAFHFLTGPADSAARLSDAIGFGYEWDPQISQYAHAAAVATVTPDGRLSRWLYGLSYQPTDLRLALLEAGQGAIGDAADKLLLLCYRYDPKAGRYNELVGSLLKAGGGLTVAAIGSLIGFSVWRGRRSRGRSEDEGAAG
jgi:protein SCO1/2